MNIVETAGVPNPCKIVNVVSTYRLGVRLNLRKLAQCRRDSPVKFNPMRFAAATINLEDDEGDNTTALCFGSGNMVHTGATTEEKARLQAHTLVRYLNEHLGIPAHVYDFTITNMVCDFKLGFEVNLASIRVDLGPGRTKYDPLKFPACRIKSLDDPKMVGLVYFSGGTVLTGLKNRQGIHTLHKSTYEICRKHIYVEQGSVSKTELRLEDIKKASSSDILDRLSKAIGEMTMNKSRSSDRKSHKMIMGKIGKKMKGILYLGMDNMSWLDSGSIVPFVPSVK